MLPTLHSPRLTLRPFALGDAADVQRLAGDARIAETTTTIPHPYPDGAAEAWIHEHESFFAAKKLLTLAVTRREDGQLLGTVSLLDWHEAYARAELGYWIGAPYWGMGYCTEAVTTLLRHATDKLKITRVVGRCLTRNKASERVMLRVGLSPEGYLPKHVLKNGRHEDVSLFGMNTPGRGRTDA